MAQVIESNDIFGKIGRGFGQGLGEQIPKEMGQRRLSEGLKKLGEDSSNLSPLEFLTKAYGTYGVTPQMVQSLGEAAKFQNARNAFMGRKQQAQGQQMQGQGQGQQGQSFSEGIQDIPFGGQMGQRIQQQPQQTAQQIIQEQQQINQPGQPQVNPLNPLRTEAQPVSMMNEQQKQDDVSNILADNPTFNLQDAYAESDRREQRRMQMPEAERKKDIQNEEVRGRIKQEFKEQLEKKLEKQGDEINKSITGENSVRVQRLIEKDLRLDPKANISDVVNKRTNQVLDLAKSKVALNVLANRDFTDKLSPMKSRQTLDKLNAYQKSFEETGNSEEFYNLLKAKFGLSPMAAASQAYPLNKNLKSYVSTVKPTNFMEYANGHSRRYAQDVLNQITPNDSLLSIAFNLKKKDANFNQNEFFDELNMNRDNLVSPFQKRELEQGASDIFPNWGDLLLLPWGG